MSAVKKAYALEKMKKINALKMLIVRLGSSVVKILKYVKLSSVRALSVQQNSNATIIWHVLKEFAKTMLSLMTTNNQITNLVAKAASLGPQ